MDMTIEQTPKARSTKINKAEEQSYLLNKIPRDLWEAAKTKAAEHNPPLSMRWILICLIEKWVGTPTPTKAAMTRVSEASKRSRAAKKQAVPAIPPTVTAITVPPAVPDLGDVF